MFENKVVVITGGAQGIGLAMAEAFRKEQAHVCLIDLQENPYFQGDLADRRVLEQFAQKVIQDFGHVDIFIHNAPPLMKGLQDCSWEEFDQAMKVGVYAPFYLVQLFEPVLNPGASIVLIFSSRDRMSQPNTESYAAAKGGLHALTHALAMSLAGRVRVNSVSPGWIETQGRTWDGPDALQHPAGRVGRPEDVAETVLFLCSDKAGFITVENICVDGGMTRQMVYHADEGWNYTPDKN